MNDIKMVMLEEQNKKIAELNWKSTNMAWVEEDEFELYSELNLTLAQWLSMLDWPNADAEVEVIFSDNCVFIGMDEVSKVIDEVYYLASMNDLEDYSQTQVYEVTRKNTETSIVNWAYTIKLTV